MAIDASGGWIPEMVPQGYRLFNEYRRFVLIHGPRRSGKSLSMDHRICRHLWENNNARVGIICKTLRNGKVGVWRDLTGTVIPQWINAGFGFRYSVEPKMEADSKMSFFRVKNMHRGESEVQLHSLEHDDEVELKFKDTRFSMIYLVEADKFKNRIVFDRLTDQLRIVELPYGAHQFVADTNPPDEGEDHWLHDVFMKKVGLDASDAEFADKYLDIFFPLYENHLLDPAEIDELDRKYKHNKIEHDRFYSGLWVRDVSESVFAETYNENMHVIGNPEEKDPEVIVPGPGTFELFSGWDIGDLNHAAVIGCRRLVEGNEWAYDIIDDLVVTDRQVGLPDFVDAFLEKMEFWENYLKNTYQIKQIKWRHWSDSSSLRFKSAISGSEALIIRSISDGRINLLGVPKGTGSVKQRIDMLKKMLFDGRVFFSASCRETIKMLRHLKRSTRESETLDRTDPLKHVFDALTYMLGYEAPMHLIRQRVTPTVERRSFAMA